MPTFTVPGAVPVVVDVPFGNLHVVAGTRDDVVVTVLPADPTKAGSVRAAEETRVRQEGDAVTIVYPASWRQYVLPFAAGGAQVTIELPAGSDLRGKAGSLYAEGRLGTVELTLNGGDARVDEVARLDVTVSAGSVVAGHVTSSAAVRASAGSVRVTELSGEGEIRARNGSTSVGALTGTLRVDGVHGDVTVGTVRGTLEARAAAGSLRVDRVESGALDLTTSYGSIEVGVPQGTAAWLDVSSKHGTVRNGLTASDGPVDGDATVEVRAGTGYGDVVLRRP